MTRLIACFAPSCFPAAGTRRRSDAAARPRGVRSIVVCLAVASSAALAGCRAGTPASGSPAHDSRTKPSESRTVKRTISLTQGVEYQGVTDTSLDASRPSACLYYADEITVKGAPDAVAGLVRFDDVQIGPAARVVEAFVALTLSSDTSGAPGSVSAHRLLSDVDFEYASWDFRDASNRVRWGGDSQSGLLAGVDYESDAAGCAAIEGFAMGDAVRIDVTSAVSAWIKDPGANRGLVLLSPEGAPATAFHSSKSPDAYRRPRLYVTYRQEIARR